MRSDALGFFWRDEPPPPKQKKQAEKRTPPERVWERPDYLPGLEEALAFNVPYMTPHEVVQASDRKEHLILDCEVFTNYFLVSFMSYQTGKVFDIQTSMGTCISAVQRSQLEFILDNFVTIGFNSLEYDLTMLSLWHAGVDTTVIKAASDALIQRGERPADILKTHRVKRYKCDHIDLMEVAPLHASLKVYAGRINCPRMQDLPFPPHTILSEEQKAIVRWYCCNDLSNTAYLRAELKQQLALRDKLTQEYGIDLRSKSDAQIAEAIISKEVTKLTGSRIERMEPQIGRKYRFPVPPGLTYQTPELQWVLSHIKSLVFEVGPSGAVETPAGLKDLVVPLGKAKYRMGIGGLHSCEERIAHVADDNYILRERDVTSYYPFIILNLGLYPESVGPVFNRIYGGIVHRRLQAKKRGDKIDSESLKITINGSFGKLGSPFSILYSPDLLFRVTISGQLYLLMLIERLELAGMTVVSANTDGIFIKCLKVQEAAMQRVVAQWEADTGFNTEENDYLALYSRDVNNYIGVKSKGKELKVKGAFAKPGMSKNPTGTICIEAIEALLQHGTPIDHTINACQDIRKFVTVRTVRTGAVKIHSDKSIEYLGKAIRWYYATGEQGYIVNAESGNKVPKSIGARPAMQLPTTLPDDVDRSWYIAEAEKMLESLCYPVQHLQTVTD